MNFYLISPIPSSLFLKSTRTLFKPQHNVIILLLEVLVNNFIAREIKLRSKKNYLLNSSCTQQ